MTEPCGCICSPRPVLSQCLWSLSQPAYIASPPVCQFGGGTVLNSAFPLYSPYSWTIGGGIIVYPVVSSDVLDTDVWESGTLTGSSGSTFFFRLTITDSVPGGVVLEKVYLTHPSPDFPIESVIYVNPWDFRHYYYSVRPLEIYLRMLPEHSTKFARWITSEKLGCDQRSLASSATTVALGTIYNRATAHVEAYYTNTTTGLPYLPSIDHTLNLVGVYYSSGYPYYPGTGSEPIAFTPFAEYGLEGSRTGGAYGEAFRLLLSTAVHCASGEVRVTSQMSRATTTQIAEVARGNDWHTTLPIVMESTDTGTFLSGETWERWLRVTLESLSYSNV